MRAATARERSSLGSRNVAHPGVGPVYFNQSFAGNPGDVVTATTTACTDGAICAAFGSTSEFSNAATAVATAVGLMSFTGLARDRAVDLAWQTGSELDNLGFHLYRGPSADGPWMRLTSSLIPSQGFSAMGASYTWRDSGLQNGTRYFYRLEDVDTRSFSTFHGPISAVPQADAAPAPPEGGGSGSGAGGGSSSSCPSWALAQLGSSASYTCETHGDPAATSFRVLSRTPRSVLVELDTAGLPHRPRRHGTRPRPRPRLRLALRSPRARAAPEARPPRRRRGPPGPDRLHPGARQPLLLRPRRRRRRLPAGRRRSRRHRESGPTGSRASPLPRRLPPRAGPTGRRGLPGGGQDPRPRAHAPALRRLAQAPSSSPGASPSASTSPGPSPPRSDGDGSAADSPALDPTRTPTPSSARRRRACTPSPSRRSSPDAPGPSTSRRCVSPGVTSRAGSAGTADPSSPGSDAAPRGDTSPSSSCPRAPPSGPAAGSSSTWTRPPPPRPSRRGRLRPRARVRRESG